MASIYLQLLAADNDHEVHASSEVDFYLLYKVIKLWPAGAIANLCLQKTRA